MKDKLPTSHIRPDFFGPWLTVLLSMGRGEGGGGAGGSDFPLPVPFNPSSRLFLLAPASLCFFDCKIYEMLCNFIQFLSLPGTFGNPLPAPLPYSRPFSPEVPHPVALNFNFHFICLTRTINFLPFLQCPKRQETETVHPVLHDGGRYILSRKCNNINSCLY